MSKQEDAQYWESEFNTKGFNAQRRYPSEAMVRFLAKHFFSIPHDQRSEVRILELGCGGGANLWVVGREGFEAHGLDISASAVETCGKMMELYNTTAKLVVGDMTKLPYEDNYFDAIFDVYSLQAIDLKGHEECFKESFRCLKPGGWFYSWHMGERSYSFWHSQGKRIDRLTVESVDNEHAPLSKNGTACFMNPVDAEWMLKEQGFTNIGVEVFTRSYYNLELTSEFVSFEGQKPA